jgi:hypothetical protein
MCNTTEEIDKVWHIKGEVQLCSGYENAYSRRLQSADLDSNIQSTRLPFKSFWDLFDRKVIAKLIAPR